MVTQTFREARECQRTRQSGAVFLYVRRRPGLATAGKRRGRTPKSGDALRFTPSRFGRPSDEFPFAVAAAASAAIAGELAAMAIDHLGEIATEPRPTIILASGDDIAAIGAAIPVIAAPDWATETLLVGPRGIRAIIAIHVTA